MAERDLQIDMGLTGVLHKVRAAIEPIGHGGHEDFSFRWAGVRFHGAVSSSGNGGATVTLRASLCQLPFRAENAEARIRLAALIAKENHGTPGHAYHLGRRGEIGYASATHLHGPLNATVFAHTLVVKLLSLRPALLSFRSAKRQAARLDA